MTNPLLTLLTSLADTKTVCPTNADMATTLRRGRSYVVRHIAELIDNGTISTRGTGKHRIITITATGAVTAAQIIKQPRQPSQPHIAPPCAICGDPVVGRSGKFPRSCAKPSCRIAIRATAYGEDPEGPAWPIVLGPIETSFHAHELSFRPDVRRGTGRPLNTSYGVSSAYIRERSEV